MNFDTAILGASLLFTSLMFWNISGQASSLKETRAKARAHEKGEEHERKENRNAPAKNGQKRESGQKNVQKRQSEQDEFAERDEIESYVNVTQDELCIEEYFQIDKQLLDCEAESSGACTSQATS